MGHGMVCVVPSVIVGGEGVGHLELTGGDLYDKLCLTDEQVVLIRTEIDMGSACICERVVHILLIAHDIVGLFAFHAEMPLVGDIPAFCVLSVSHEGNIQRGLVGQLFFDGYLDTQTVYISSCGEKYRLVCP